MKKLNILLFLLVTSLLVTPLAAAPGDLDPTFGPVGFITTAPNSGPDRAFAAGRQPDGKLVFAGAHNLNNIAIVRYLPSGAPDTTFDGEEIFTDSIVGISEAPALRPDGMIDTAGTATVNFLTSDFSIVRPNANATFETFFASSRRRKIAADKAGEKKTSNRPTKFFRRRLDRPKKHCGRAKKRLCLDKDHLVAFKRK